MTKPGAPTGTSLASLACTPPRSGPSDYSRRMNRVEQRGDTRRQSPLISITRAGLTFMITLMLAACSSSLVRTDDRQPPGEQLDLLIRELENPDGPPLVVAHRACWRGSAENSLQAISSCIEHGIDMVEIDVRRTADGELVLLHDESLDRTTTGSGFVSGKNLRELRPMKLRSDKGGPESRITEYAIPTLREALEACRGRILVNIDAKEDIHEEVIALISEMRIQDQVVMKKVVVHPGGDDSSLRRKVRFFMPVIDQRMVGSAADAVLSYQEHPPVAFEIVFQSENYLLEAMPGMKRGKARVWVNTLSSDLAGGMTDDQAVAAPAAYWGRLLDQGVNILQTDRPIELIDFLRTTGKRIPVFKAEAAPFESAASSDTRK